MLASCDHSPPRPLPAGQTSAATVSVVIRVRTSKSEILHLLKALAGQTRLPEEIVLIDSGSSAPILDRLRGLTAGGLPARNQQRIPVRLLEIPSTSYQSARTLNQACQATRSSFMAVISQDAIPCSQFLERLLAAFQDPSIVGVYGRQVVRDDSDPLIRKDLDKTYPARSRVQDAPDCWFVNTCSMIRRSFWEQHPFDERAGIAEDHEWARWWQGKGFRVKYESRAAVRHSHCFRSPTEIWDRFYPEGLGLAYVHQGPRGAVQATWCLLREVASDGLWLARRGQLAHWPKGIARRAVKHYALYRGFREGFRRVERGGND